MRAGQGGWTPDRPRPRRAFAGVPPRLPRIMYDLAMNPTRLARYLDLISDQRKQSTMEELTQRIAEGEAIDEVARAWDVPRGRLITWVLSDEGRKKVYLGALEHAAYILAGEVVRIADEVPNVRGDGTVDQGDIAHRKLRIDTRFRLAERHAKEMYGAQRQGNEVFTLDLTKVLLEAQKLLAERRSGRDEKVVLEVSERLPTDGNGGISHSEGA